MENKKVKVGVIGLGVMGKLHTSIFQSLQQSEVIGCVEINREIAEEFEKNTGIRVYDNIEELLPKVDAVSICTPDDNHKYFVIKALESGKKCLIEKPFATNSADCDEMIAKMPDETYIMVGHLIRFDSRAWAVKNAIKNGQIGRIHNINICRNSSTQTGNRIGKRTSITWFLGIHDIDLVLWLTGQKVKRISASGKKIFNDNWDYVASLLELEDGTIVCMENGWHMPPYRVTTLDAGIKVIGEKGMIEISLTHNDARLTTFDEKRSKSIDTYHWPSYEGVIYGDLRIELESFINSVITNSIPPCTAREAAEAVRVIERIEQFLEDKKE
jgi:UDP-N-acetylglucosamine 3-dehydrogenase